MYIGKTIIDKCILCYKKEKPFNLNLKVVRPTGSDINIVNYAK